MFVKSNGTFLFRYMLCDADVTRNNVTVFKSSFSFLYLFTVYFLRPKVLKGGRTILAGTPEDELAAGVREAPLACDDIATDADASFEMLLEPDCFLAWPSSVALHLAAKVKEHTVSFMLYTAGDTLTNTMNTDHKYIYYLNQYLPIKWHI